MTKKYDDDFELDSLFEAARNTPQEPSPELLVTIQAQALQVQQSQQQNEPTPRSRHRIAEIFESLGGWPSLAGVSTAALAGIWIGMAPPETVALTAQTLFDPSATDDLFEFSDDTVFAFLEETF